LPSSIGVRQSDLAVSSGKYDNQFDDFLDGFGSAPTGGSSVSAVITNDVDHSFLADEFETLDGNAVVNTDSFNAPLEGEVCYMLHMCWLMIGKVNN